MKKIYLVACASCFIASLSVSALAANSPDPDKRYPGAEKETQGDFKSAKKRANSEYRAAKTRCSKLQGDAEKSCRDEAKVQHDKAMSSARANSSVH